MIDASLPLFEQKAEQLKVLLDKSDRKLHPLTDPLRTDFAVHRWLAADREEAYSDWLAWIVGQIVDPAAVFRLFGVKNAPGDIKDWQHIPPKVRREDWIPEGHPDQEGRLDLYIQFETKASIMVEIKKWDADSADTDKNTGYMASLKSRTQPCFPILLATDGQQEQYEGFHFRSWDKFCVTLRRLVPRLINEKGLIVAALVLAFIGAVEQNLLGFSSSVTTDVLNHSRGRTFNSAVVKASGKNDASCIKQLHTITVAPSPAGG